MTKRKSSNNQTFTDFQAVQNAGSILDDLPEFYKRIRTMRLVAILKNLNQHHIAETVRMKGLPLYIYFDSKTFYEYGTLFSDFGSIRPHSLLQYPNAVFSWAKEFDPEEPMRFLTTPTTS